MGKKRLIKFITFILTLCLFINYYLDFESLNSVPKIEFGQRVEASSKENPFNFNRKIKLSKVRNDGYDFDGYINATFDVSGDIKIEGDFVTQSIKFNCDLPGAYKYNYITDLVVYVYMNNEMIGGYITDEPKRINNSDGACSYYVKYEIDRYIEDWADDNDFSFSLWFGFRSCEEPDDYHYSGNAFDYLPEYTQPYYVEYSYPPVINATLPKENDIISGTETYIPSMTVSDANGDKLTCKYYIDSVFQESRDASNTETSQYVPFSALDTKALTNGYHTFKFEVYDGDNSTPVSTTVRAYIDKSPPVILDNDIDCTSDDTSITITGSATDDTTDANSILYRYTVGSTSTGWVSDKSKTFSQLSPDTDYNIKFEAMDKYSNIAAVNRTVRTKAQVPRLSIIEELINTDSVDIQISDQNPSTVQYQLMCGSKYVNSSGELISTPAWITLTNKRITVKGLIPNTTYKFTAIAKGKDGVSTALSNQIQVTTKALGPTIELTKGIKQIIASWKPVSGAIGYIISADGVEYSTGTTPTFIHNNLQPETTHTYKVRVRNAGGTGPWGNVEQATTLPNPPETPVITGTSTTQSAITINWDAVAKATGYEIEADGKIIDTGINTAYTDDGLEPDSSHKYRVRSKNAGGNSEWSVYTEISTLPNPPEIPENLAGKPTMKNITLTWNAAERAEGYELEIDGKRIDVKTNTYIHEGLTSNTSYKYRIRAYNKGGKSLWSEPVTVTTWPDIPAIPTNIMATAEQNSVTLTWYSSPYAECYDIQIDEKNIVNLKGTSYTNQNLTQGTNHSYRVRAINISGNSQWSSPVAISTLPQEETGITTGSAIIANIAAVVTNKTITIAWQAVEANAQYDIEVDGVIIDNGKETVYYHTGLKAETPHTYKVRSKNANGNGQWCAVLTLSTLPDLPDAPKDLKVTVYDRQIYLSWTKVEGISYEVEVDGKTVEVGQTSSYIDENLTPGTAHTYRVRGKNITGVTAWSDSITKSTTSPAYEVVCLKGDEFNFSLLAANVQDFGEITFVVSYNSDQLEVVDLCEFTTEKEVATGSITGTNITVKATESRIEFKVNESIKTGTTWSGEISTIVFRAKTDGKASINYTIE